MEHRLAILCQAGVIDEDICLGIKQVLDRLEQHWQLPMRTEQGEMALTHMANALMRARREETINALDPALLAEIEQAAEFDVIHQIHQEALTYFTVDVPESEVGYLLANWYSLYLNKVTHIN